MSFLLTLADCGHKLTLDHGEPWIYETCPECGVVRLISMVMEVPGDVDLRKEINDLEPGRPADEVLRNYLKGSG